MVSALVVIGIWPRAVLRALFNRPRPAAFSPGSQLLHYAATALDPACHGDGVDWARRPSDASRESVARPTHDLHEAAHFLPRQLDRFPPNTVKSPFQPPAERPLSLQA